MSKRLQGHLTTPLQGQCLGCSHHDKIIARVYPVLGLEAVINPSDRVGFY